MSDLTDRATIPGVEYRVLGPLSARVQGEPRKLGGRRQQMVLAVLLSNPNEVTSQDKLIESVWAGLEPESAKQTLHSYVSNLRKELGGGIDREGTGYVVHIDNDGLDSTRFEALVGRAREALVTSPAAALGFASEALALWHGPAFGDLGGEPALTAEAMRLEEMRLATLEIRVEADIAVGNHAAVIQELDALTTEHPFRERLWGFLMLSLYRAGRQADALRSYRELSRILGEELGIEPAAELQALEEQILTQDPALDYAASGSSPVDRAARGYELREQIRETPFGVLLRGFQGSVGREVAVLKLDEAIANDPSFIRRFETEMRSASELEHPHLVSIYDFWRDPEGAYLVTALPRGGVLREVSADQPWNLSSVVRIVDQVTSALSYLHRNGFVHGSFTTESILLDEDSNAYLSDVGLSALVPGPAHTQSPADDVAALAALAMSLLTGSEAGPGTRLSELRPDLADLDDLFSRALHDDPASRFQKPEELRRALRQATGADVVPSGQEVPSGTRRNPYKGLRAFKESEAVDFHGRDALVEELVEAVASSRLIAVVGPSGSGKSSLVRAGLLPALRSGAIEGSTRWLVAEMFPGTHPFEELEAALVRVATERPSGLFDELTADSRGLARAAKRIIGNDEDQLVIVVDQFEELFSLVTSETNRRLFLESLTAVATDERSRIRLVLTLRADFFDQPLQYPEFAEAMSSGLVPISPPTEEGLTRAIAQPARGVGVDLQPGLVTRIVDDVRDEPGGLPLMQYALTELFNQRVNNTMTLAAYEQSGGVAGALANRADEIYSDLSDDGRIAARNLFLRLVNVDELADDTRRRVRQTELKGLSINQAILDDVVQQFGAFRLLSFDRDAATRTPTVEVAHEALIREWTRLRTWIDDRREELLIHRRIQITARDWEDSGKDPSYLLRGSRLEQALIWQERADLAISDDEMTFIEASIEQEKRDQAEHQALEEKAARRRKAVIGVLVGGLVVAGVLGAIALDRAQSERITAARATARELSAASLGAIEEDQQLATLLALKAIEVTEEAGLSPVPEAISALRATQVQSKTALTFDGFEMVAYTPDGNFLITDGESEEDQKLYVRDADTGEVLRTMSPDHQDGGHSFLATFDPVDPTRLAVSRDYSLNQPAPLPELATVVDIFNTATGSYEVGLKGVPGNYTQPSFSSSGLIASSSDLSSSTSSTYVWDTNGTVIKTFDFSDVGFWIIGSEFLPGTETLLLTLAPLVGNTQSGAIVAIEITTEDELWRIPLPDLDTVVSRISPDGKMMAVGDRNRQSVRIVRLPEGDTIATIPNRTPQTLAWAKDGSAVAVSGNTGDVSVVSLAIGRDQILLSGHESSVFNIAFAPDGSKIASVSIDGYGRVWNLTSDGGISLDTPPSRVFSNLDGSSLLLVNAADPTTILNVATGEIEFVSPFHYRVWTKQVWTDDTLRHVAGVDDDGRGMILDTRTGDTVETFDRCVAAQGMSGDGRYVLLDSQALCPENLDSPSSVLDRQTGETIIELGHRYIPLGTFHGGSEQVAPYVAVNVNAEFLEIYSLDDRSLVATIPDNLLAFYPLGLHTDPTGKYLGVGLNGGAFIVFDMEKIMDGTAPEDAVALSLGGHKANVPDAQPTSDGRVLTAGHDGIYRMWSIETGQLLWEIRSELRGRGAVVIPRSESQMYYQSAGLTLLSTPLDSNDVIELARAAVTRTLTDDECRQYLHTDGCVD